MSTASNIRRIAQPRRNRLPVLLSVALLFLVPLSQCGRGDCAEDNNCSNNFVDMDGPAGEGPQNQPVHEGEPNNFFFSGTPLPQTPFNKVLDATGQPVYDHAVVGTIDNNTDEDWYVINLTAEDFDRITPAGFNDDGKKDCSGIGPTDGGCGDAATVATTDEFGYHQPNGTPDSVEQKFLDAGLTENPYDTGNCTEIDQNNCAQFKYHKPRHTVEVVSRSGEPLSLKIEIFAPGLSLDQNGALTKKPIAVLENTANEQPLDVSQESNQKLVFPKHVEHYVRVMDGSTEGELKNRYFYHSCYCESGLADDAAKRYGAVSFPYEMLIQRNLNLFRNQDPYGVGKYYIRVTSNGDGVGHQYNIRWFWDNSFADGDGGKLSATYLESFPQEPPCPLPDVEDPGTSLGVQNPAQPYGLALFDCPNPAAVKSNYRGYPAICEYDKAAVDLLKSGGSPTAREIVKAFTNVYSESELAGGYPHLNSNANAAAAAFCDWDSTSAQCYSDFNTYEPYTSLIRFIPSSDPADVCQ